MHLVRKGEHLGEIEGVDVEVPGDGEVVDGVGVCSQGKSGGGEDEDLEKEVANKGLSDRTCVLWGDHALERRKESSECMGTFGQICSVEWRFEGRSMPTSKSRYGAPSVLRLSGFLPAMVKCFSMIS